MCLVVCGMAVDGKEGFKLLDQYFSFPLLFNGETPMLSFFLDLMYFQNGLVLLDFSLFSVVSFYICPFSFLDLLLDFVLEVFIVVPLISSFGLL
jgi:hypothetical protein